MSQAGVYFRSRWFRVLAGPLGVLFAIGILVGLYEAWGIRIPQAGVVFVVLVVMVSMTTDLWAAIVSTAMALAAMLWYYFYIQQNIGSEKAALFRMVILVIALPAAATVVLIMRWRLERALAAPAEAEKLLFQAVMASMHDAIIETDWKGIRNVNDSFCRMTGFSREELIGVKPPYPFWPVEQYATIATALETSMRGQALDFELVMTRKTGERFPVLLSVSRILENEAARFGGGDAGNASRVLYSFRDITDIKRAQEKLQQQSRELEAAKEAAENANHTKDRFLNLLSHELRSPLTPILTLASVLENDSRLPEDVRHDMATIRRNAENEGRLMDDLLELVRVAKGTLPPDVDTSVRGVRETIVAARHAPSPSPMPAESPARTPLRILLVEDHADTSRVLSRVLGTRGHHVTVANSVQQGVDAVTQHHFDFLIADIGLPDGTGLELMQKISTIRQIPAIALSGFGGREDVLKSRQAGFLEHLTKPVNLGVLEETIERLAPARN